MSLRDDESFDSSDSNLLRPLVNGTNPRRSPAKLNVKAPKRSTLSQSLESEVGDGMHSLAHELAAALMPEPSAGQKLLAEEFGLEFDEGADGIDDHTVDQIQDHASLEQQLNGHAELEAEASAPAFAVESPSRSFADHFDDNLPSPSLRSPPPRTPTAQDPIDVLSRDIEETEAFLQRLRRLDMDIASSSSQLSLEKVASEMIQHINEVARDREGQVRELLEYDREFRKISGEVGGNDVLSQLDELYEVDGLKEPNSLGEGSQPQSTSKPSEPSRNFDNQEHSRRSTTDWEINPDDHRLGDEDEYGYGVAPESPSAIKDAFPVPPAVSGPPTVATTAPLFVHMRSLNSSLATSLTAISEHAQVNGAASADAGRKIRALKNKLGGWRSEWDSAERSRQKIERWEAGLPDDGDTNLNLTITSPLRSSGSKRIDGRVLVLEHLRAFEAAVADAGVKTQTIMARA